MRPYKIIFVLFLSFTILGSYITVEHIFAHQKNKKFQKNIYKKKSWKKRFPHKMLFNHVLRNKVRLGLSETQISKLKDLSINFKKTRIMNRAKLRITGIDLKKAIRTEFMNMKLIEKIVKRMTLQRENLWMSAINAIAKTKTILTSKQLQEMKKIITSKKMKRRKYRRNNVR